MWPAIRQSELEHVDVLFVVSDVRMTKVKPNSVQLTIHLCQPSEFGGGSFRVRVGTAFDSGAFDRFAIAATVACWGTVVRPERGRRMRMLTLPPSGGCL